MKIAPRDARCHDGRSDKVSSMFPFKQFVTEVADTKSFAHHICASQNVLVLLEQDASDEGMETYGELHCK